MRKLISCKYHADSQTVELPYTDGTLIDIDCLAVDDEVARCCLRGTRQSPDPRGNRRR